MKDDTGIVFDIGRFMTEDGPGIRTCVFMKGCPLRCKWCSNAYGLERKPQLAVIQNKCNGCGRCIEVCPLFLIQRGKNGKIVTGFSRCIGCGKCTETCLCSARTIIGKKYTVDEIIERILEDRDFYRRNSGGVTFSGGEILLQPEFVREALKKSKEHEIHTAIETSGFGRWNDLEGILSYTDFIFMDIKALNREKHKMLTGQNNDHILDNIRKAAKYCRENHKDMVLRLPLIPGLNDDAVNIRETAEFVKMLDTDIELNILPYHKFGIGKYENIGKTYKLKDLQKNSDEKISECKKILTEMGILFSVGGANVIKYRAYQ